MIRNASSTPCVWMWDSRSLYRSDGGGLFISIVCCLLLSHSNLCKRRLLLFVTLPRYLVVRLPLAGLSSPCSCFSDPAMIWSGRNVAQLWKWGGVGGISLSPLLNHDSVGPGWLNTRWKWVYRPLQSAVICLAPMWWFESKVEKNAKTQRLHVSRWLECAPFFHQPKSSTLLLPVCYISMSHSWNWMAPLTTWSSEAHKAL